MNRLQLAARAFVLVVTLVCCASVKAQSVNRYKVSWFQTDQFQSITNPLPTESGGTGHEFVKQVIYSIDMTQGSQGAPLAEGEILLVMGELQGKQTAGTGQAEVFLTAGLYLGTQADYLDGDAGNAFMLTELAGENLDFESGISLSEETWVKLGTYVVPANLDSDRKFVNFMAYTGSTVTSNVITAVSSGSSLTVMRFTPIDTPTQRFPSHGVYSIVPHAAQNSNSSIPVTGTTAQTATIIYDLDLDDPDSDQNQDDAVDLQVGDVIVALGECEATYTGTANPVLLHSQVLLVGSATTGPTTVELTRPNDFSMLGGARGKNSFVKAGAMPITALPSSGHWKHLRLVAWKTTPTNEDTEEEVNITATEVDTLNPDADGQGGKLTLLRLRHATGGIDPMSTGRYDQPEYNLSSIGNGGGSHLYDSMERTCTIPSSTTRTLFSQVLANLHSNESLLVVSQTAVTDENDTLKTLGSRLIAHSTANSGTTFTISNDNELEIHRKMHHAFSMKAAIKNVPSAFEGLSAYIDREVWSNPAFNGTCADSSQCSTAGPGYCSCSNPISGCDIVSPGRGRLAVLRLTPTFWCFADCFPHPTIGDPGLVPDGQVGIDDLVTVVTRWGQTGAGIWGDIDDNGTIGIDDLVAVILHWGPNCDGTLQVPQSVADCLQLHGGDPVKLQACLESLCLRGISEGCQ